jgi:hypothetical protein
MDGLLKRMAYGAMMIIFSALLAYVCEPGNITDAELIPKNNKETVNTTKIQKNILPSESMNDKKFLALKINGN